MESAIEQYKRLYNVNCDNHSLYHQARFFADFGINWQKEQMMANAIDAEVLEDYDGKVIEYDETILDKKII